MSGARVLCDAEAASDEDSGVRKGREGSRVGAVVVQLGVAVVTKPNGTCFGSRGSGVTDMDWNGSGAWPLGGMAMGQGWRWWVIS